MTDCRIDVDVALAAAEAGAAVVRFAYGGSLVKHPKSPTDFATDTDLDAERAILEAITTFGRTESVQLSGVAVSTSRSCLRATHAWSTSTATGRSTERSSARSGRSTPACRAAFGPRVMSTTLAVAWVAAGRRAGYVSDGHFVGNVHFTAGIELCRAAGCVVTDLHGAPLETGRGLIVAADAATHEQIVGLVAPHLAAIEH